MDQIIQITVLGIGLGGVFALMGAGLSLVFGVMRIVNLAHPSLIIGGAYLAYWGFRLYGIDPLIMLPVCALVLAATGVLFYKVFFERDAKSATYSEMTVLLTFAIAMIVEGALGAAFSNTQRVTSPGYATDAFFFGDVFIPKGQLYAGMVSILIILLLGRLPEILAPWLCDPGHHPEPGCRRAARREREHGGADVVCHRDRPCGRGRGADLVRVQLFPRQALGMGRGADVARRHGGHGVDPRDGRGGLCPVDRGGLCGHMDRVHMVDHDLLSCPVPCPAVPAARPVRRKAGVGVDVGCHTRHKLDARDKRGPEGPQGL
jgi:hypothetical protein